MSVSTEPGHIGNMTKSITLDERAHSLVRCFAGLTQTIRGMLIVQLTSEEVDRGLGDPVRRVAHGNSSALLDAPSYR
jgi:hypothetical protein